ncbi:MAG: hypothetical protein M3R60_07400 [Pseudomonadota bacterium]|nr:hypothetical protein [Pseudomonadota bacterium]
MSYNTRMYIVNQTQIFRHWLQKMRDKNTQVRIAARIRNAEAGNLGDSQQADTKRAIAMARQIKESTHDCR